MIVSKNNRVTYLVGFFNSTYIEKREKSSNGVDINDIVLMLCLKLYLKHFWIQKSSFVSKCKG